MLSKCNKNLSKNKGGRDSTGEHLKLLDHLLGTCPRKIEAFQFK